MVRLPIHELETAVSTMVKWNQPTTTRTENLVKPSWWPGDYQFPLSRRPPGLSVENWRQILLNLISKCGQFTKAERLRAKTKMCGVNKLKLKTVRRKMGTGRPRRDSTGSSNGSTVSSLSGAQTAPPLDKQATIITHAGGRSGIVRGDISSASTLAKTLGLSQNPLKIMKPRNPFVQVYDICKINPSMYNLNPKKCDIKPEKDNFMSYFGLTTKSSVPCPPSATNIYKSHKNYMNYSHIPFSSNIGLKLLQGASNYDTEIIEKRLERVERYLCNNDLPTLLTPIKDTFKISNTKKSHLEHFYIFPTKKRHTKNKLTPKARFLLTKYCKPCSVNLSASGDEKIKNYLDSRKNLFAFIDLTNTEKENKQKENKTPPSYTLLESRVVLTTIDDDKFKENLKLSSSSTSIVKKSERSNFALQTLAPRNENTQPTANANVKVEKRANFINPSVVLQPIQDLFHFTNRKRILNTTHSKLNRTPYKVLKTRVNVYNPRRFSTRLINV